MTELSSCCSAPVAFVESTPKYTNYKCSRCGRNPCNLQPPAEPKKQSSCCGSPVDHEECPCWSAGCMGPNHRCKKCGSTCYLKKEGEKITSPPPAESATCKCYMRAGESIRKYCSIHSSEPSVNSHPSQDGSLAGGSVQTSEIEALLAELTAKIVEAVDGCRHDVLWQEGWHSASCRLCHRVVARPSERLFTLEDVLRALGNDAPIRIHPNGVISDGGWTIHCSWKLGKPLSEQSPELHSYLHSLLHGE